MPVGVLFDDFVFKAKYFFNTLATLQIIYSFAMVVRDKPASNDYFH
jgi:hypothetical protein